MGKSKRRMIYRKNSPLFMTREDAISNVRNCMFQRNNLEYTKAKKLITLFGLNAEELSEAGIGYEDLKSFGSVL